MYSVLPNKVSSSSWVGEICLVNSKTICMQFRRRFWLVFVKILSLTDVKNENYLFLMFKDKLPLPKNWTILKYITSVHNMIRYLGCFNTHINHWWMIDSDDTNDMNINAQKYPIMS